MKVGDLVRLKHREYKNYGVVISILIDNLVGVMWAGSEYVYAEPVSLLEVVDANR
jgi:hypothetical protein